MADDERVAQTGPKRARDVIADTIAPWVGDDADLYQYVDKIMNELDRHSYWIMYKAKVHRVVDMLRSAIETDGESVDG